MSKRGRPIYEQADAWVYRTPIEGPRYERAAERVAAHEGFTAGYKAANRAAKRKEAK
jgi:hypothetical protein